MQEKNCAISSYVTVKTNVWFNLCFRYVLDGFPMTLTQTELMESQNIIPMLVFELRISTVEVLLRGLSDKLNPDK